MKQLANQLAKSDHGVELRLLEDQADCPNPNQVAANPTSLTDQLLASGKFFGTGRPLQVQHVSLLIVLCMPRDTTRLKDIEQLNNPGLVTSRPLRVFANPPLGWTPGLRACPSTTSGTNPVLTHRAAAPCRSKRPKASCSQLFWYII